jgi:hypothetical protein
MNIQELFQKGIEASTNQELLKYKNAIPHEIFNLNYYWDTSKTKILQHLYALEILDTTQYSSESQWCENFDGDLAYAIILKGKCIGVSHYKYLEEEHKGLTSYFDYYWQSKESFKEVLEFLTETLLDDIFDDYHSLITRGTRDE